MKKLTSLLLSFVMIITLFNGVSVSANNIIASGTCGDNLTWTLGPTGDNLWDQILTLTISGTGEMYDYKEREEAPWFQNGFTGGKIVIEEGVQSIGARAFYGYNYFSCGDLFVELPESLKSIGEGAFYDWQELQDIDLKYVEYIGDYAFYNCREVKKITFPENLKSIGQFAFENCVNLRSAEIKGEIKKIELGAFSGCEALNTVKLPNTIKVIGQTAFRDCTGLRSINIPNGVTNIGMSAFDGCKYLPSIDIPDSVKEIGDDAFGECASLTTVRIPEGISTIKFDTFSECTSLMSVEIPESVKSIEAGAFYKCESLTDVYFGGDRYEWEMIEKGVNNDALNFATIHFNCYSTVAKKVFNGTCGDNIKWTYYDNGLLVIKGSGKMDDYYSKDTTPWRNYRYYVKTVMMIGNITNIGNSAFSFFSVLENIAIPRSVTSIGNSAFYACNSLDYVKIPDNVTSIGDRAFYGCNMLSSTEIPAGVTRIPYQCFSDCTALTDVIIPDTVTNISESAFSGCTSLTEINIPQSVRNIGVSAFSRCSSLASFRIPDGIEKIDISVFWNCSAMTSVYIPKSVKSIERAAFSGCTSLKDVYYSGSKNDWNRISVSTLNDVLQQAKIHFNDGSTDVVSHFAEIVIDGKIYDLLSQPVNVDKESKTLINVKINYEDFTGKERIWLSQDPVKAIELENNKYKGFFPAEVFDADKDIYVLIVNEETGEAYSERTRLKVVENTTESEWMPDSGVSGLNFKLGKNNGFTIPDDVPVFGGTDINWDFGFIPISVEYDREDSNKINVVFGANIASSDGKEDKFFKDFDFKEYKKDFKNIAYMKDGRTLRQLRNHYQVFNKNNRMSLFGGTVIGGGSGDKNFDFNVAGYAEAKIIDGEFTFIEGQILLEAEVSYTYQGQLFIWVVPVYYEIGGGVGAGFEGNMINIDPENFTPQFEAYLTAKLKATLGAGVGLAKAATVGVAGGGSLNLKTALHKDYLKAWGEGNANFNVKVFGKEVAKKDFLKGEFLIYETGNPNGLISDSAVALASFEDENLYNEIDINAVYKNESRTYTENSTEWYGNYPPVSLFSTDYTNKNLQLLAENVYTESSPQMQEINGKKVMVMLWDNTERDAVNRTMIVYSVYDDEEKTWSEPTPVYDDGTADFYPSFNDGYLVWQNEKALLDDTMTLADIGALGEISVAKWNGEGFDTPVTVTDNDTLDTQPFVTADGTEVTVFWTTNTENDIIGITGKNSIMKSVSFGAPETVKDNLNSIINLSAGYIDNVLNIAYVEDPDNNLSTVNEREISVITDSTEYDLTDNDVLDSNPVFENNTIYYYSNGNIVYGDGETVFKEAKSGLTDAFTVNSNGSGDVIILWAKNTDTATEIFSSLYKDNEWSDEIQVSDTGNSSKYPTGILNTDGSMYIAYNNSVIEDGEVTKTDLYTIDLVPSYDLAVTDAYFDEETMTAYATVKNVGEASVGAFMVALADVGINSYVELDFLKAGESVDVELKYIVPEKFSKTTVGVMAFYQEDEFNTDNNIIFFDIGNCDVEVAEVRNYETIPFSQAAVVIGNNGYSDTGEITVNLRRDTADGEIVDTQVIENLPAGDSKTLIFDYDIIESLNTTWYVTAETESTEISKGNNDAFFVNDYLSEVISYNQNVLSYSIVDGTLTVTANLENNTAKDFKDRSILALCDKDGYGINETYVNVEIPSYSSTTVEYKLYNYTPQNGDYLLLYTEGFERRIVAIDTGEKSFTVSGTVTAFGNSSTDLTIELLKDGEVVDTKSVTSEYSFEEVEEGTYTLKVSKTKHTTREYEITVSEDTTQDVTIWLYGDVTGEGIINSTDLLQISRKIANLSSVFNQAANADYRLKVANLTKLTLGDDVINSADLLQISRKVANLSSIFDSI